MEACRKREGMDGRGEMVELSRRGDEEGDVSSALILLSCSGRIAPSGRLALWGIKAW